jgi:hypothetical protein
MKDEWDLRSLFIRAARKRIMRQIHPSSLILSE